MVAVQNLKGEIIQLILSRKGGGAACKCVKFHKNPISGLGGVALTRYMDEQMDGRTDRVIPIYPPNFVCRGDNNLSIASMLPVNIMKCNIDSRSD
jgi:hypothetical protein